MARRSLSDQAFASIADGERDLLERITFRPRLLVSTLDLDLSLELFGQDMFAPILVGPASGQQRFHEEGEVATAKGAAAAKATIVTAEESGATLEKTAALAPGSWRQVYPDPDVGALAERGRQAEQAGCRALCLTLGDSRGDAGPRRYGWDKIEQLRDSTGLPLVLKGIMHPADASSAVERGVAAIVVSTHGAGRASGASEPLAALPAVTEEIAGRIPVLLDGGIRRGSDVLKALALGATAALVCRPALWGLAAYGVAGVQKVVEMLQTELARDMAQLGTASLRAIRREHIRIHRR